jgi:hypothetical protein
MSFLKQFILESETDDLPLKVLTPRVSSSMEMLESPQDNKCVVIHVQNARDIDLSNINAAVSLVVIIKIYCGKSDRIRCTQTMQTGSAKGTTINHPTWDERCILSLTREDQFDICYIQFEIKDTTTRSKPSFGIARTPNLKTLKNKGPISFPFIVKESSYAQTILNVTIEVRNIDTII